MENAVAKGVAAARLNDLSGTEWVRATKSIMFQQGLGPGHPHAQIERRHPAPFAYRDAERLVRLFSRSGDRVLDPFAGVGSTLKACAVAGRRGLGFELNGNFQRWSIARLKREVEPELLRAYPQEVKRGDALELSKRLRADSFDFVLTSPPYWDILSRQGTSRTTHWRKGSATYGKNHRDLAHILDYDNFLNTLGGFLDSLKRVLKPTRYMAVVVADFRRGSRLYPFHADLINAVEGSAHPSDSRGFVLQGIKIVAQNTKRLYPYGFPTTYVPNIHHQYVLIFRNLCRRK